MNKVIIVGRLTKDPELKCTANGVSVTSFTVAVNRKYKNDEGNYDADFINCVAWRQQADFLCKFFNKGDMVGIVGSIQTRNYDNKDGQKVYVTEVGVEEVHFVGGKSEKKEEKPSVSGFDNAGFVPMPGDDDLPY